MSYVLAFAGFAALIILHEAGHFAAAKAVGMRVERFSLFFGPLLVKFRRGETEYGIGPIPLGGYVKITGMNPNEEIGPQAELREARGEAAAITSDGGVVPAALTERIDSLAAEVERITARAYYMQAVWKRIVVILAGPLVNIVIAFAIIWALLLSDGQAFPVTKVAAVQRASAAARYIRPGDRIVSVDGVSSSETAIRNQIGTHVCAGRLVAGCQAATAAHVLLRRDGRLMTVDIRPRYSAPDQHMELGIEFMLGTRYPGAISAAGTSASGLWSITKRYVSTIVRLFEPKDRKQLHGVVGGYEATQQSFAQSPSVALQVLALISLSLGVINLFPFLPLDGGHIFWALAEKVRGRQIQFATMERAGLVGVALIVMLFFVGLSNDISTIASGGNFLGR